MHKQWIPNYSFVGVAMWPGKEANNIVTEDFFAILVICESKL